MKKIMLILLVCGINASAAEIKTPADLAKLANCDAMKIGAWEKTHLTYKEQSGRDSGAIVLARGWGDCKGFAVLTLETLKACGIRAHIMQLSQPGFPGHVIAVFTLRGGRHGYISGSRDGVQYREFKEHEPWTNIIKTVGNGKWKAIATDGVMLK